MLVVYLQWSCFSVWVTGASLWGLHTDNVLLEHTHTHTHSALHFVLPRLFNGARGRRAHPQGACRKCRSDFSSGLTYRRVGMVTASLLRTQHPISIVNISFFLSRYPLAGFLALQPDHSRFNERKRWSRVIVCVCRSFETGTQSY